MSAFHLPAELADRVTALAADLESYVTEARDEFAERTERWQEGGDGIAADGWLEEVEQLGEALSALPAVPQ